MDWYRVTYLVDGMEDPEFVFYQGDSDEAEIAAEKYFSSVWGSNNIEWIETAEDWDGPIGMEPHPQICGLWV